MYNSIDGRVWIWDVCIGIDLERMIVLFRQLVVAAKDFTGLAGWLSSICGGRWAKLPQTVAKLNPTKQYCNSVCEGRI